MEKKFEFKEEELAVDDYRAYYDSKVLRVWHLEGREKSFTIAKVTRVTLESRDGIKKQPLVHFMGVPLPLALNKTNGASIEHLYGRKVSEWVGKRITLYPTKTQVGRDQKECIRIREKVPTDTTVNKESTDE
jgi:hypothetical protein